MISNANNSINSPVESVLPHRPNFQKYNVHLGCVIQPVAHPVSAKKSIEI